MWTKKNIIIVAIVGFLVLLLIGGVIWYWQKSKTNNVVSSGGKIDEQKNVAPKFNVFIKPADKTYDLDRDGISNEEEKKLGLNPNSSDTDGDGLSDYDEINIWKTDPKKPDTDGDGYSDGLEIATGNNPLGSGKLK